MKVIPVIDLKSGVVVRGVGGRRDEYQPVRGVLSAEPTPGAVARGIVARLGCRDVYVADLDAITGGVFDWASYADVHAAGLTLWVDAGVGSKSRAENLRDAPRFATLIARAIIGLESIERPEAIADVVNTLGTQRCIFSLDLKHGVPITHCPAWAGIPERSVADIARTVFDAGLRSLIVLDLAGIGEDGGVRTLDVCRRVTHIAAERRVELELISGGGVRDAADLALLARAGCSAALVASALHDGRITARDILQPASIT